MNKYQKALDQTQKWLNSEGVNYCASYEHTLLKELVDRATPKEPKIEKISLGTAPCCPNCHSVVYLQYEVEKENFCAICGQALDWSDDNND